MNIFSKMHSVGRVLGTLALVELIFTKRYTWLVLRANSFSFHTGRQSDSGVSSPYVHFFLNSDNKVLWAAESWRGEEVVLRLFIIVEEKQTLKWRIPLGRSRPSLLTVICRRTWLALSPLQSPTLWDLLSPPSLGHLSVSILAPRLHYSPLC